MSVRYSVAVVCDQCKSSTYPASASEPISLQVVELDARMNYGWLITPHHHFCSAHCRRQWALNHTTAEGVPP